MKILLINSPSLGVIEPWMDEPDFTRPALVYLAGYLREHSSYEIKIIDAKYEKLSFDEVLNIFIEFQPRIVGFTAFTNEIKPSAYLAKRMKNLKGDEILTVIGGAHATALPIQTLKEFDGFDTLVFGEGEITFHELCDSVNDNSFFSNPEKINGVVYRKNSEIIKSLDRNRILDQDIIPMPAWDLVPKADVYWVQTQRGCPFKCVFCMNHNGRIARKSSVLKVIDEIEFIIRNFNPKWIRFGDELFSVDMERTMDLLEEMIKRKIGDKVLWDIQTHVNFVSQEMFYKLKEANCTQVDLGVETGDVELLKKMGKGTNHKNIIEAFKFAKNAKVKSGSFFLFGQPNENKNTLIKTIKFAVKLNPDVPMFGMMVPYPGTKVAKLAANNEGGYLNLSYDWDQYRKQIGGAVTFANLSRTQTEIFQILGYVFVFIFNFRFLDFTRFFISYRKEAFNLLVKVLRRENSVDYILKKPIDYDQVLSKKTITRFEMENSYTEFEEYQKKEIKRSKSSKTNK